MNEDIVRHLILRNMGHRTLYFETGSAQGESAAWALQYFDRVITVEFCEDNYVACLQRFWNEPRCMVIRGDSGLLMPALEYRIEEDAVVMLDAHYVDDGDERIAPTGVTPVLQELDALCRNANDHVIFIDDARLFGTVQGYPSEIELSAFARDRLYVTQQQDDVFILNKL